MTTPRVWGSLDPFFEAGDMLGRRMANAEMLGALLRLDPFDEYHFFCRGQGERAGLESELSLRAPDLAASGRIQVLGRLELPEMLGRTRYAAFHQSDCITAQAQVARLRNRLAPEAFPVTGTTHSLSYAQHGAGFLAHLWPGVTARDRIVATSRAGAAAVRAHFARLREGYGLSPDSFPEPGVDVIPLGVGDRFFSVGSRERSLGRAALGAASGQCVILVLGRIQHHSKMDLLPLFRAMQRLRMEGTRLDDVLVVLAGWVDADDQFPDTLAEIARNMGLPLAIRPRPSEEEKLALLAAADVFCSPSDNPQETFGLTILEAMASGLSVVASDYDGYRDLVRDGETGLFASTIGPAGTADVDALAPVLGDNQYHLLLGQRTAVDVRELAAALGRLINDPALRRAMGDAGRRAAGEYRWERVAAAHVELWERLWAEPVDLAPLRGVAHPLEVDYARTFAAHPTHVLSPELVLSWSRTGRAVQRGQEFPLIYAGVAGVVDAEMVRALVVLARKPVAAGELAARLAGQFSCVESGRADALVLWALKNDLLEIVEAE